MDRGRMFEIADLIKRNRAGYKSQEQPGEQPIAESSDGHECAEDTCTEEVIDKDIEEPSDDLPAPEESQMEILTESVCPDKAMPKECCYKGRIVETLIDNAHKINLNSKNASVLLTLIRLLKMDFDDPESQKDMAEATEQAVSTIERHIRHLRENNFIETEQIVDEHGTRTIYKFDGLKDKLHALEVEI